MLPVHRLLLLGTLSLPLISACGSSSVGTESGTIAPPSTSGVTTTPPVTPPKAGPGGGGPTGSEDSVTATSSVAGTLSVAVGASQTVSVTFTSSDALAITGFAVSGSLGSLPAGWSGPGVFSCGAVGPGSGCVMSLTYAPTALDSGTLTLNCVYIANSGLPRTPGPCLTLTYAAIAPNNVSAYVSPTGEIDAIAGVAKQIVTVNFTSDDGNAATALTLTSNLASLPSGWSSSATNLTCPIVSTGSGCQLRLVFAPTAAAAGTLTLNYTYLDNSGASRMGALNIPYATTSHDSVVATASPGGQVNAAETTGTQSVSVTFTTNDGAAATGLGTALTGLPAGWSSKATTFSCASVSSGNGCQLQLTYAPTMLGGGVISLPYAYTDSSGAANAGLLTIPYAATTNDNAVATPSPSGQITAIQGAPAQPVSVTFVTDDSRLATALQITGGLAQLPAGWSSAVSSFACSTFSSGTGCQLTLMYAPTALDDGTLTLNYSYLNNAGDSKTGTVAIAYRTTTNDNVVATALPNSLSVLTASSNPVTVTFTTDDGELASALVADLSALPADWSSASSTFTCAGISTGTGCQLVLNYSPSAPENNTLSFGFSYTNNSGIVKTGTASIAYVAAAPPPPGP
jgi:hypothetical protein